MSIPTCHRFARRAPQRGAAMVETALVFPMFIILWFTTMWVYRTYDAKLALMAKSRGEAWGFAMNNCGKSGAPDVVTQLPTGVTAPVVAAGAPPPITQFALTAASTVFPVFILVAQVVNAPIDAAQAIHSQSITQTIPNLWERTHGAVTRTATAKVTVFCNEAPQNGDLAGVFMALLNMAPLASQFNFATHPAVHNKGRVP